MIAPVRATSPSPTGRTSDSQDFTAFEKDSGAAIIAESISHLTWTRSFLAFFFFLFPSDLVGVCSLGEDSFRI